jgi:cerevisin
MPTHTEHEQRQLELKKRSLEDTFNGLKHTYMIKTGVLGYSGQFDHALIEQLRKHQDVCQIHYSFCHKITFKQVKYIEHDSIVHAFGGVQQNPSTWNLARLSHRARPPISSEESLRYIYSDRRGRGVDIYVLDSGVQINHTDFGSRAKWGKTILTGASDEDESGHGTHVAGVAAGQKYGVSKMANIIAVKVLGVNGKGITSDVLKGIEFVVKSHNSVVEDAKAGNRLNFKGSVVNVSFGTDYSPTMNEAVNAAAAAGVHISAAAGNDNDDACWYSPGSADAAITVGAIDMADAKASYSSWGGCVSIFAPGTDILSTYIGSSTTATKSLSGTSMAAPHVAGLIAYLLSLQPDSTSYDEIIDPETIKIIILYMSSKNTVDGLTADTLNVCIYFALLSVY